MKVLSRTEAIAVRVSVDIYQRIGVKYFVTTLGEGDAEVTIEFDEGIISVKNAMRFELYLTLEAFSYHYGV